MDSAKTAGALVLGALLVLIVLNRSLKGIGVSATARIGG